MTSGPYPSPGENIAHYRIERRLGSGGMGVVFEATDEVLNRRVALKVISPHLAESPEFRARFTREAQAQAALDSPHVVQVYASGEDAGRLWLASQLIPDGDLGAMLGRYGAPPVALALDLIAQVASGLADAHAIGLVHRDIKPANVLLRRRDEGYTAYLADFGIVRQADSERTATSQSVVGTPSYMAPELHTGGTADARTDIYSLGCVLWACLSGRAPYGGSTDFQIVTAHLEQPIPQLPGTDPLMAGANAILRRAMAKEPAQRYESAAAMRDDLRRLHATAPEAAFEPSHHTVVRAPAASAPAASAPQSTSARRTVAMVVGLVVLVLIAAVGTVYAIGRNDDEPADSTTLSPTVRPTETTEPTEPTEPTGTGYQVQEGDEEKAVASLVAALVQQPSISQAQAECIAPAVIDQIGLQRLVDLGFFDAEMNFINLDLAEFPEVRDAMTAAALSCATASSSPS